MPLRSRQEGASWCLTEPRQGSACAVSGPYCWEACAQTAVTGAAWAAGPRVGFNPTLSYPRVSGGTVFTGLLCRMLPTGRLCVSDCLPQAVAVWLGAMVCIDVRVHPLHFSAHRRVANAGACSAPGLCPGHMPCKDMCSKHASRLHGHTKTHCAIHNSIAAQAQLRPSKSPHLFHPAQVEIRQQLSPVTFIRISMRVLPLHALSSFQTIYRAPLQPSCSLLSWSGFPSCVAAPHPASVGRLNTCCLGVSHRKDSRNSAKFRPMRPPASHLRRGCTSPNSANVVMLHHHAQSNTCRDPLCWVALQLHCGAPWLPTAWARAFRTGGPRAQHLSREAQHLVKAGCFSSHAASPCAAYHLLRSAAPGCFSAAERTPLSAACPRPPRPGAPRPGMPRPLRPPDSR